MGHLVSKNSKRVKKRRRKTRKNCILHGPCMLCFIVHNTSTLDDDQLESASKLAERYATLTNPEECAKFILSPKELGILEERNKNLLSGVPAKLIGNQLFQTVSSEYSDMVCKRKCTKLQADTPCKQLRCAGVPAEATENGLSSESASANPVHVCLLPSPASCSTVHPIAPVKERDSAQQLCSGAGEPLACENMTVEPLNINHLPSSILLKIFSNLSLDERGLCASLVCKYWRDLCLDFQLWKQLDLSGRAQVKDDVLIRIASWIQNLTEINISDCRNVTDKGVCFLISKSPGLLKYTACRCKQLNNSTLDSIAQNCHLLQKLHVGNQDKLTDEGLKQIGEMCPKLKDIHFGQCYQLSDEGMVAIAKGCPNLQRIYMQENKMVTDKSVKAFAEHCPELQYVGFMGCSVTSEGVIHLTRLRQLSSLDLRHITELNNETVMEVVKKCKNLSSLNLCLNWCINDRCVEFIAKEGRSLKELYLVSCRITDYALIAIGQYSVTIETVDVGWCKEITDQGAMQISKTSKSLRYLGLMRCDKVNEETVEQLVQQYPHITFSTVMQDCKRTLERAYQMGWTPSTSAS